MQLDVLAVGHVGRAPGEPARDVGHGAQLLGAQLTAVDTDPQHEVPVVQLLRLQRGGLPAVDALPALGVQAEPAEPSAQVSGVDRVEPALGVDIDDPVADVQAIVVLLEFLVLVQGLVVAKRPLPVAAALAAPVLAWTALVSCPGRAAGLRAGGPRRGWQFGGGQFGAA